MSPTFPQAFLGTLVGILDIFLVVLGAGFLVRRKVISQTVIDGLSAATVIVFLPCLIFGNVVKTLDPARQPLWWVIPLTAALMAGAGLALGWLLFRRELPEKQNMLPLAAMQNAGYMVLPIGLKLFPQQFDTFALYSFLFIMGMNPVLWSVGKRLVTGGESVRFIWKQWITPPMLASLLAIAVVLSGTARFLPDTALGAIRLMGGAAVPAATFVLGAVLGSISFRIRPHWADAGKTIGIKLFVLPALTILALCFLGLAQPGSLLAQFFVIEAAVPPATGLILQVRHYGGNEQKLGSLMLLAYALSLFTLPLWLSVWNVLVLP